MLERQSKDAAHRKIKQKYEAEKSGSGRDGRLFILYLYHARLAQVVSMRNYKSADRTKLQPHTIYLL